MGVLKKISKKMSRKKSKNKTDKILTTKKQKSNFAKSKGLDKVIVDNVYKDFIEIRYNSQNKYQNKTNPETNKKYTEQEILLIADKEFKKHKINHVVDTVFAPVGVREGKKIMNKHYKEKYGEEQGEKKIKGDMAKSKIDSLEPQSKQSYLYRKNKLFVKTGPEDMDLIGVDAKKKVKKSNKSKKNKSKNKSNKK